MPRDMRPNNLVHWRTRLITPDSERASRLLRIEEFVSISAGVVTIPAELLGFKSGFLARDPDRYAVALIEQVGRP